jgi:hypothetical protein
MDQLVLGTLLFTILFFLFPTIAIYYVFFSIVRLLVTLAQAALWWALAFFAYFPFYALVRGYLWERAGAPRYPGGVCFALLPALTSTSTSTSASNAASASALVTASPVASTSTALVTASASSGDVSGPSSPRALVSASASASPAATSATTGSGEALIRRSASFHLSSGESLVMSAGVGGAAVPSAAGSGGANRHAAVSTYLLLRNSPVPLSAMFYQYKLVLGMCVMCLCVLVWQRFVPSLCGL